MFGRVHLHRAYCVKGLITVNIKIKIFMFLKEYLPYSLLLWPDRMFSIKQLVFRRGTKIHEYMTHKI